VSPCVRATSSKRRRWRPKSHFRRSIGSAGTLSRTPAVKGNHTLHSSLGSSLSAGYEPHSGNGLNRLLM
jgi:hypothetical protein